MSVTSVRFNGVEADFVIDSDTQITAVVPVGATTGKIAMTNASGTGESADDFTVLPVPLADYRFDEGSGDQLTDYSGNGYHGTLGTAGANKPTWDPKGLVFSTALSSRVQLPHALWAAQPKTVIVFLKTTPPATAGWQGVLGVDSLANGALLTLRSGSANPIFFGSEWPTSGDLTTFAGNSVFGDNSIACTFGAPRKIFLNGVEATSYNMQNLNAVSNWPAPTTRFWLGFVEGFCYTGTIYGLLFYSDVLTQSQIAGIHAEIATTLLSRGVTLGDTKTNRTQGVFDGNSITESFLAIGADQYPTACMAGLTNTYNWVNLGIGNFKALEAAPRMATRITPLWGLYSQTPKVYVLELGTNDMDSGQTPAQIYANLKTCVQDALAGGATDVVLLSMMSRTLGGFPDGTTRVTFNALLTSDFNVSAGASNPNIWKGASWTDPNHVYLYNVGDTATGAEANLGAVGAANNATYFVDTVHPTPAGYAIMAAGVRSALQKIGLS